MIPGLCFFSSSVLHDVNIFVEERLRDLKSAHIVQSTEQLVLFFLFNHNVLFKWKQMFFSKLQ